MIFLITIIAGIILYFANSYLQNFCPAKVMIIFWLFQIIVMVLGGAGFLIFNYKGIIYILITLAFIFLGAFFAQDKSIERLSTSSSEIYFSQKKASKILILFIALGFLYPIRIIISHGYRIESLFNFNQLLEVNNGLSVSRYVDDVKTSFVDQILNIFSSLCPLLGGFYYLAFNKSKDKYLAISTVLPQLFGGLTQGVKMGIITTTFLWFTGYILCSFLINRKIRINFKTFLLFILGGFALISVLALSMMFRIGTFDLDTFYVVAQKFISYAFGHLPAFDAWFSKQSFFDSEYTLGGKMFFGITNYLGIMHREQGLYQDLTTIAIDGSETNVYSVFRLVIDDFGIFGSILFYFIFGFISQKIYKNVRLKNNYVFYTMILAGVYFFIFWSFVTSVFVYMTYIAMLVLFMFVVKFSTAKNKCQ